MVTVEMGDGYATDGVVSKSLCIEVCYIAESLLELREQPGCVCLT
jgi:hypothetical protein